MRLTGIATDFGAGCAGITPGNTSQAGCFAHNSCPAPRNLAAFKKNVEKHPDTWFVELGLARGYSALGDFENA